MNRKDLIKELAKHTDASISKSKIIIDCLFQTINQALKQGDKVTLRGFGAFDNIERQGRNYYDIRTKEIKTCPVKKVVKFIPYKRLKEKLFHETLENYHNDDGSVGNHITLEKNRYSLSQHPYARVNSKHTEAIIGQRSSREFETETSPLVFHGYFQFDHFQGEEEHNEFPSLKIPHKETPILMPQVDRNGATEGVMEPILRKHLYKMCKEIKEIKLLENIKLPILNRNYPYRPDFCLYWKEKELYIDIEIDEPYDIVSRKPIHFLKNGDNLRDRYFIRNGWCVIRFAEQQIKNNIEGVTNYIKRILRWLTEETEIQFHENTLEPLNRWSYEEASEMAANNIREQYLNLPNHASDKSSITTTEQNNVNVIKPSEDILPPLISNAQENKWLSAIEKIKSSGCEYCKVTRANGYQWIFTCKSLKISSIQGYNVITGESPLGIELPFALDDIIELTPLKELFSDVQWTSSRSMSPRELSPLKEILFDAIAYGKPIWVTYNSTNSGRSTRFLSNIIYSWNGSSYKTPHIGLGHCKKYGILELSYFYAYCSKRKELRIFAADERVEELKVLNCDHVYFTNDIYANSFNHLVMSPYEYNNGNAFFENADEILRIMPQNEFESAFVQGNLANLQVMKGEISKAVSTYQQHPYDLFLFINSSLTWGETCMADIHSFIDLCKEHLNDSHFYEGLDANVMLQNFEEVLRLLTESSWIKDKA